MLKLSRKNFVLGASTLITAVFIAICVTLITNPKVLIALFIWGVVIGAAGFAIWYAVMGVMWLFTTVHKIINNLIDMYDDYKESKF